MENIAKTLGIRHPIIQAPMAGSDNAAMVAAASEAGVLGSLGGQYRTPEDLRKTIIEIKNSTDKPFAVNLFALPAKPIPDGSDVERVAAHLKKYYERFGTRAPSVEEVQTTIDAEEQLAVLVEEKIAVFSFTLGTLAQKWIDKFKSNNTTIIGTATNVVEAQQLQDSGADIICVQGIEAGGHRGTFIGEYQNSMIGLMALIPQVAQAVDLPVIAAGGIMNGRGIAAALTLGASGVQMGTAFLMTAECPVHRRYKEAIISAEAHETEITKAFSGGAARGITNNYMNEERDSELLPFPYHNALTRPFRKVANDAGEIEYTNLWSGQAGKLARVLTTKELVELLVLETNETLQRMSTTKI